MQVQSKQGEVVFLSPHLDDAVLSCAGTINRLSAIGAQPRVVTIFAGSPRGELSPLAENLHRAWRLPFDAPACRREENRLALMSLNARSSCLTFLDSIYRRSRRGQPIYTSKEQIFSGSWPQEPRLLCALVRHLRRRVAKLEWTILCAPLGIGSHVDHLLVHEAAEKVCIELDREELVFYEDLPYAIERGSAERALTQFRRRAQAELVVPLTEADMRAKERAIGLYTSQSEGIAGELGIPIEDILGYASLVAGGEEAASQGERFWASTLAPLDMLRSVLKMC